MKKIRTDSLILHMEIVSSGPKTRMYIDVENKGTRAESLEFVIPNGCAKQTVSDSGLAKHILNYFIKD